MNEKEKRLNEKRLDTIAGIQSSKILNHKDENSVNLSLMRYALSPVRKMANQCSIYNGVKSHVTMEVHLILTPKEE